MTGDIPGDEENSLGSWREAMRVFYEWEDADATQQADVVVRLAARNAVAHAHLLKFIAADREAKRKRLLAAARRSMHRERTV